MMTTILKVSRNSTGREAMLLALRDAGLGVEEVDDWEEARERLARAVAAAGSEAASPTAVPGDSLRALSHELRTPLSAMAGWLHLLETGKLDAMGTKRAIEKLRGNIEDQVRMLDRYVGSRTQQGRP